MIENHFNNVDLNLLVVLQVLMEERSVTRTAGRLNRTQPAISRSLARLRLMFHDPLFVRAGSTMQPTPRAEVLFDHVSEVLRTLQECVLSPVTFSPETSTRTFVLKTTDFGEALLLPTILARLVKEAPGIKIVLGGSNQSIEVDLMLGPIGRGAAALRTLRLGSEDFWVVARKGHRSIKLTKTSLEGNLTLNSCFNLFCLKPEG